MAEPWHTWIWVLSGVALATAAAAAQDCPVFSVRDEAEELAVVRQVVPAGEVVVWRTGGAGEPLDILLPVGPGVSGSLVARDQATLHSLGCIGGNLEHTLRLADGRQVARPPQRLADLQELEVRVSVVTDDGRRAAFLVTDWNEVGRDGGPVQNLLASAVLPAGIARAFVTTESRRRDVAPPVRGSVELAADRHLFAWGSSGAGQGGWFVVDTGGAQSLVTRSLLPGDAAIVPAETVEYSAAGRRSYAYSPGGATGPLQGVLGHATVARLVFGGLVFPDARVAVVDELPDLFGRPVVGILGLDLLARGRRFALELPVAGRGEGRLVLAGDDPAGLAGGGGDHPTLPLSLVSDHLVISASSAGATFHGILDTGAPDVLVDPAAAAALGVTGEEMGAIPGRGVDGGSAEGRLARLPEIVLGRSRVRELAVFVADLPALAPLRLPGQHVALLGNSFLARFARVEIDLPARTARFVPRPTGVDER